MVWMTLIFGIVFFILAKWGFPMITSSLEKRAERINESIRQAKEAEERLAHLTEEQNQLMARAEAERTRILRAAAASRDEMIEEAKEKARAEASRIIELARTEIAVEKESAIRDVRRQVSLLSVSVAEKVLRNALSSEESREELIGKYIDEASSDSGDRLTDN